MTLLEREEVEVAQAMVMLRRRQNLALATAISDSLKVGGLDIGEAGLLALAKTIANHRSAWLDSEWRAVDAARR